MNIPKRIKELKEKLNNEWTDDNVLSVGSGYGYYTKNWRQEEDPPIGWFLTVYAKDVKKAESELPHEIGGVHIRFSDIPWAL